MPPLPFKADLGGPQIYHVSFYLFAAVTKNTKYPRTGLRIGLRGRCLVQPALFFEPEPVPRLPGPRGAGNRPKTRGRIYHFILPKVCPVVLGSGVSKVRGGRGGPWDRGGSDPAMAFERASKADVGCLGSVAIKPRNKTYNLPGQICGATCTIVRAGAVPGAPRGRQSVKNPGPD